MSERNEPEVLELMRSVQRKYFPSLADVAFCLEKDTAIDGVAAKIVFGKSPKITVYYSDDRIISSQYRAGLVPVVGHELAHLVDPVDPDRILAERLPASLVTLWQELREAGIAACSFDA